jgi:hypothetical protein
MKSQHLLMLIIIATTRKIHPQSEANPANVIKKVIISH